MTDTVRIMPKQPFEVALGNGRYWPTAETQQRATYFPAEHWQEVSDPIVWDGTDEALAAIKGDGLGGCWKGDGYKLWPVPDMEWAILLPDERSGWSVVTTSSGPVILPPKEVTE